MTETERQLASIEREMAEHYAALARLHSTLAELREGNEPKRTRRPVPEVDRLVTEEKQHEAARILARKRSAR